ncbi:MAG: trypsin-like peptidase domain-containing protein [Anaerolineales bacterium]|nr:trypsin-like peptidase domain-containing protein [Anaerolineales bacterium]
MNFSTLLNTALDELLARVRPALAVVQNGRRGAGVGVLVGEGLVLTSNHVIARGRSFKVKLDDDASYEARVLFRDPEVDLALLGIPANGHPAAVFSEKEPRPGEMVFAFGHPWGQRNVLTGGVLSAVTAAHTQRGEIPVLRTDARLAPGNSGGPLLNAAGEVIGLNAMIFGGDQGIAIPASVIRAFLDAAREAMPADAVPEGVL